MASFFSFVDPIFYLHHCNLDRLADVLNQIAPHVQGRLVDLGSVADVVAAANPGCRILSRVRSNNVAPRDPKWRVGRIVER